MKELRKITQEQLEEILYKHELWLEGKEDGERADLSYVDLEGAYLAYADLENANLKYALTNAFIYDGANIYFFLEPAKITWGTNEVTVPFFSYVFCDYSISHICCFVNNFPIYYNHLICALLGIA